MVITDYVSFLWVEDPLKEYCGLVTYRFKSVLIGATASPFLLNATIKHHLQNSVSPYATQMAKGLYVDNIQGTSFSEDDLLGQFNDANNTFFRAGMTLRK